MKFSEEAERFMRPGGDRLVALAGLLAARSLPYAVIKTGEARHLLVRIGMARPRLVFVAHYDRIAGTSGALDNSCACLQLVDLAARHSGVGLGARLGGGASFLVAFTDAEEAPGSGEASTQGSYSLARRLKSAAEGEEALAAIVLDVTGRGGRLLLSTASGALLSRTGLGQSPAARGNRFLVGLAKRSAERARLRSPLEASLPWSDDLGLTLGGLPALAVSLLPETEAEVLAGGGSPPLWKLLHTGADLPELAEEGAFALLRSFLDALLVELAGSAEGPLY